MATAYVFPIHVYTSYMVTMFKGLRISVSITLVIVIIVLVVLGGGAQIYIACMVAIVCMGVLINVSGVVLVLGWLYTVS